MSQVTSKVIESREKVGKILKSQREKLGLRKIDITRYVGYKNANFVAKLESGGTSVPIANFKNFSEAYQLSPESSRAVFKELYPERWEVFQKMLEVLIEVKKNP